MEFRILGPLDVVDGERVVALAGAKHRALLAMLLLHANEVVSTERLIDALWEDERPETAQKALQVYISQLRKTLDRDRLHTKAPGYLHPGRRTTSSISLRFQRLMRDGDPARGARALARPAACRVRLRALRPDEIARLEELHLACLEQRIDARPRRRDSTPSSSASSRRSSPSTPSESASESS